jgi:hypothetical protein
MPKPEWGTLLVNALEEQVVRGGALRSSDDFAVAFGG